MPMAGFLERSNEFFFLEISDRQFLKQGYTVGSYIYIYLLDTEHLVSSIPVAC